MWQRLRNGQSKKWINCSFFLNFFLWILLKLLLLVPFSYLPWLWQFGSFIVYFYSFRIFLAQPKCHKHIHIWPIFIEELKMAISNTSSCISCVAIRCHQFFVCTELKIKLSNIGKFNRNHFVWTVSELLWVSYGISVCFFTIFAGKNNHCRQTKSKERNEKWKNVRKIWLCREKFRESQ